MSKLTIFNAFGNSFQGRLPEALGNLTRLESIGLSSNDFDGPIADALSVLLPLKVNLRQLDLGSNRFTGQLPELLGEFRSLLNLWLSENSLEGSLPSTMCNFKHLRLFDVHKNSLTSEIPPCVSVAPFPLFSLDLSSNHFSGDPLPGLCSMSSLRTFDISNNPLLSWTLPACNATQIPLLRQFIAQNAGVRGATMPSFLTEGPQLQILWLAQNRLSLDLSQMNWNSPLLTAIVLSDNRLSGQLPPSIFNHSPALDIVAIEGAHLRGTLPDAICGAQQLTRLYLSGNRLDGELLPCITRLSNLRELRLGYNNLDGPLPARLGDMSHLRVLQMNNNRLSGRMAVLGPLVPQLEEIDLHLNRISCDLPDAVKHWETNRSARVNVLTGNRFGCPIPKAELCENFKFFFICPRRGLAKIDEGAPGYACGNSQLKIPLGIAIIAPTAFALAVTLLCCAARRGSIANMSWWWIIEPVGQTLLATAGLVVTAVLISLAILLPVYKGLRSAYSCQYTDAPTLALKAPNESVSCAFGVAIGISLVATIYSMRIVSAQSAKDNESVRATTISRRTFRSSTISRRTGFDSGVVNAESGTEDLGRGDGSDIGIRQPTSGSVGADDDAFTDHASDGSEGVGTNADAAGADAASADADAQTDANEIDTTGGCVRGVRMSAYARSIAPQSPNNKGELNRPRPNHRRTRNKTMLCVCSAYVCALCFCVLIRMSQPRLRKFVAQQTLIQQPASAR